MRQSERREPRIGDDAENLKGSPFLAWIVASVIAWAIIALAVSLFL
jgi:hypothetical protein